MNTLAQCPKCGCEIETGVARKLAPEQIEAIVKIIYPSIPDLAIGYDDVEPKLRAVMFLTVKAALSTLGFESQ